MVDVTEHVLVDEGHWIPQLEGLKIILSSWSGKGLLRAMSALPETMNFEKNWSSNDTLERASRILIEQLCTQPEGLPLLQRLPRSLRAWQDSLPAAIHSERWVSDKINPGVNWTSTITRFGWPPKAFSGRSRQRTIDSRILGTAAWTINAVLETASQARTKFGEAGSSAAPQLLSLQQLAETELFRGHHIRSTSRPSSEDIIALRNEGRPWSDLALIAKKIIQLETNPEALAAELLWPDDELAWRLFHLSVIGLALLGLNDAGYSITSLRPIGEWGTGPAYRANKGDDHIDVWYEAGGLWKYLNHPSPYAELCAGVTSSPRALGADIALWSPKGKILLLECKLYKKSKESAARDGYLQSVTYAAEATRLAKNVISAAVLPSWQVDKPRWTTLPSGIVGLVSDKDVRRLAESFVMQS